MKRDRKKPSMVEGYLEYTGNEKDPTSRVTVIDYLKDTYFEKNELTPEDIEIYKKTESISWINVEGLSDTKYIKNLCKKNLELDMLVIEDIMHVHQRPKIDIHDKYFYCVLRMIYLNPKGEVKNEQLSIVVYNNLVITFQESKVNLFEPIKNKIRKSESSIKKKTVDYLFHAILDVVIDNYLVVMNSIEDKIYELEDRFNERIKEDIILELYNLRKDISIYKKQIKPVKELISFFTTEDENSFINPENVKYFSNLKDHVVYVIEHLENLKENMTNLFSLYNMIVSNRMNEVMKTLTIITSIFVPLTFLTGIYGMNFDFIPGIHSEYGYYVFWAVILTIAIIMITFFIRKGWVKYQLDDKEE